MPTPSTLEKLDRRSRQAGLMATKSAIEHWRRICRRPRPGQMVFVTGAQRSGTNMIMEVLDASLETRVYHERDPKAFDRYIMRPPEVIRQLRDSARMPVFVIKALCEMDKLPWLMERFAPAKTIWVLRHYNDVVNSAMRLFSRKLPDAIPNILRDPESESWRGRGISNETLALMRDIYHREMNEESRVAMFWYVRNRMFFDHGFDRDKRVLAVRYERLVTQPHTEFQRIFEFVGVPYSPRVSAHVTSMSVGKEVAPVLDPRVRDVCDELLGRLDSCIVNPLAGSTRV